MRWARSGAKPRGKGSLWFNPPPHTRLKDDSWDLHKSEEIFLPLGGGTPAFWDGIRHHTAEHSLQHKAQPVLTDYKLPGTDD